MARPIPCSMAKCRQTLMTGPFVLVKSVQQSSTLGKKPSLRARSSSLGNCAWGTVSFDTDGLCLPWALEQTANTLATTNALVCCIRMARDPIACPGQVREKALIDGHFTTDILARDPSRARRRPSHGPSRGCLREQGLLLSKPSMPETSDPVRAPVPGAREAPPRDPGL